MDNNPKDRFSNPFWDFALAAYAHEAVSKRCLALQDARGADVNLLLFLCWRAVIGLGAATANEISAMDAALTPVREGAILPLRKLRISLREPFPDDVPGLRELLRQRILEAEISAEAVAQAVLQKRFAPSPGPDGTNPEDAPEQAALGIADYLRGLGAPPATARDEAQALARDILDNRR